MRFIYEFFLEFCICAFLQLSVRDFGEFSPTLQFWLSVAVTGAIIALIAFVVSLLFCKGGPWVPSYYRRHTVLSSLMQVRPIDLGFDKERYLREHPAP